MQQFPPVNQNLHSTQAQAGPVQPHWQARGPNYQGLPQGGPYNHHSGNTSGHSHGFTATNVHGVHGIEAQDAMQGLCALLAFPTY